MKPLSTILILVVVIPASIITKLYLEDWWKERKVNSAVHDLAMAELTRTKMSRLVKAIDAFGAREGKLPEQLASVPVCDGDNYDPGRVTNCPTAGYLGVTEDAWRRPFRYTATESGYTLSSGGPDGTGTGLGAAYDLMHFGTFSR